MIIFVVIVVCTKAWRPICARNRQKKKHNIIPKRRQQRDEVLENSLPAPHAIIITPPHWRVVFSPSLYSDAIDGHGGILQWHPAALGAHFARRETLYIFIYINMCVEDAHTRAAKLAHLIMHFSMARAHQMAIVKDDKIWLPPVLLAGHHHVLDWCMKSICIYMMGRQWICGRAAIIDETDKNRVLDI